MTTKSEVLTALHCVEEDIDMLDSGEWIPDEDSCNATRQMLAIIKKFIEELP